MRAKFNVCCMATYKGEIELPDSVDSRNMDEVCEYILDHLDEVPATELEWLADTGELLPEDIYDIVE